MLRVRAPFILNLVAAAVSLSAAFWYGEGMTIGVCTAALFVAVPALFYCGSGASRAAFVSAISVLACTTLMILLFSSDSFVLGAATDNNAVIAAAAVHGAALIPQVMLFFFTMAAAFRMSLNWVMISGLGWLVGMGMSVSKYVMVLIFQNPEVEADMVMNSTIVIGMLVNLLMFIVSFCVIGHLLKKRRLVITSDGLEAIR
jgi:hypothetical protein